MKLTCNLSHWLRQRRMTQAELARQIGGYQPDISAWCHSRKQPPGRTMIQVAKILKVKVEDIWQPLVGRPPKVR